jgi:hypothetical protein
LREILILSALTALKVEPLMLESQSPSPRDQNWLSIAPMVKFVKLGRMGMIHIRLKAKREAPKK